jgi:hypothetical protein
MKARFKFNHWLPKLVGAGAITLYPFVVCAEPAVDALRSGTVAHEMVHILQVRRMGFLKMYWLYFWEFIKIRLTGKKHWEAHAFHSMEIEATERAITERKQLNALYAAESS